MADQKGKFANLHYPGMKSDPNEGQTALDEVVQWSFGPQIDCIGEGAQRQLLDFSVLLLSSSPLSIRLAQRLAQSGVGRLGIVWDEAASSAHGFSKAKADPAKTAVAHLKEWTQNETSWTHVETFRDITLDRQLDDMAKGFSVICGFGAENAAKAVCAAEKLKSFASVADARGFEAWIGKVSGTGLCEDCLTHAFKKLSLGDAGAYYPLLDWIAAQMTAQILDVCLREEKPKSRKSTLETIDAARQPWKFEEKELKARPGCSKCKN